MTDTKTKIMSMLKPLLPIDAEITDDTPLFYEANAENSEQARARGNAGLDSLDRVELVMLIEDEFELEIPDTTFEGKSEWETLGSITAFVDAAIVKEGR